MDPGRLITVGLLLGQAIVLVSVVFVSAWFIVRLQVAQTASDDAAKRNADGATKPTMPKAVLLMGLKGCDPRLSEGLRRLLNQDYGDYSVRIVIHDRTDPAWDVVAAVAASHTGPVSLEYEAYEPSQRHGIINATNAKVVQSMRRLPADVEIVAMADGDLVVERDWLRNLAEPLVDDPTCGAAFGLKWFAPYGSYWGTYVRYLWNAGAAPVMALGNMPWGGCCAIRGDVVRSAGVIDRWARIIALDAALPDVLQPLGMHAAFVPSLIVPNEEQCSLPFALNYIRRQLTWTRLYHPAWPVLFVGSLVLAFIVFLPPIAAVLFALNGRMPEAVCLALGCFVSLVASDFARVRLDARVRRLNGSPQPPRSLIRHVQILATVYLTIAVHVTAVCLARFWPWLAWRGMLLEVRGAERIRVVRDGTSPTTTLTVNHSL